MNSSRNAMSAGKSFLFGGLLPVIAFTLIEEYYGTVAGIIAGLIFGLGEIIYELKTVGKVSTITWIGNGMLVALGVVSLVSSDGIWFKLQPALLEAFFALFLWGSLIFKKNVLLLMAEKQGQTIPDILRPQMNGMTFRLGIFFALHAGLATWAAFKWSTEAWALLKGLGVMISFVFYFIFEMIYLRRKIRRRP